MVLRVLLVNKFAAVTGGADRHCLDLRKALTDAGHHVEMVACAVNGQAPDVVTVPALVTNHNRDGLTIGAQARVATAAVWSSDAVGAFKGLLRRFKPDVVHCHKLYPQLSVAPVVMARRSGLPVVQTAHDYEFISASSIDPQGGAIDRHETRLRYRLLNSGIYAIKRVVHARLIDEWITVSRVAAAAYAARGIRTTVIPNFSFIRDDDDDARYLRDGAVFVGRLSEEKGVADVLELARLLPEVNITIAGGGPLESRVRAVSQGRRNVTYVGQVDHDAVRLLLKSAAVALMPSRCEDAGPLSAVEAMACGTPIAGYRVGGLGEYVSDAGAGLVVEPGINALRTAVVTIVRASRDQWRTWAAGGRRAARTTHSASNYVPQVLEVYERARLTRAGRR